MQLPAHPAPGLGDLLPGFYVVPQNPLRWVEQGVGYVPHFGELMPAKFTVPENPLIFDRPCCASCSRGLACSGGLGVLGLPALPSSIAGISTTTLAYGAGALLLATVLFSRGGKGRAYSKERRKAREKYAEELGRIKQKYPRVGRRISRSARAAAGAF